MKMRSKREEDLKQQFAVRLKKLCDDSGFIPKGHGRIATLTKYMDVTPQSVRRWVNGETYPDVVNAKKLCDLFKANIGWLLTGQGVPYQAQLTESDQFHYTGMQARFLPVITYPQAAKFTGKYADLELVDWWPTDLEEGDYWLEVDNDSMDDQTRSGIPAGCLILVDHAEPVAPGDFALILIDGADKPIFKRYIEDGPNRFAVSLNPGYSPIKLDQYHILGKVVDAIITPIRKR